MITIQDVARLAEVSTATVSRVMNGSDKVSDRAKNKVQDAIKKLNYTPNNLGLYLRSNSTKSLLFLVHQEITLDYQFISGINNAATELGYNVVIAMINGNAGMEADYLQRVKNRLYDGVVFCMNPYDKKELHNIFESFPCVFAYVSAGDFIPSFSIDHELAAYEATESLIRSGCRTIGILVNEMYTDYQGRLVENTIDILRVRGYRRALESNGIEFQNNLVVQCPPFFNESRQCLKNLLMRDDRPDAILCTFEQQAFACITTAKELGINIPEKLSVITFSVSNLCEMYTPGISTISMPWYEIGYQSVSALINNLDPSKSAVYGSHILPYTIVQRDTTHFIT